MQQEISGTSGQIPRVFPTDCFDRETLNLMHWAFQTAWEEVGFVLAIRDVDPTGPRTVMALRIMAAVRDGERDPVRLKELALDAIKDAY